jgi:hypothetical protein
VALLLPWPTLSSSTAFVATIRHWLDVLVFGFAAVKRPAAAEQQLKYLLQT